MKNLLYTLLFVPVALFGQDNYSLTFNADDDYAAYWTALAPGRCVFFTLDPARYHALKTEHTVFLADDVVLSSDGVSFNIVSEDMCLSVDVPMLGKHSVYNALAASSMAFSIFSPFVCLLFISATGSGVCCRPLVLITPGIMTV